MKRTVKMLATILLFSVLLASLVACDSSKSVKDAFAAEGYSVTSFTATGDKAEAIFTLAGFTEEEIDEIEDYELLYFTKLLSSSFVIKFPNKGELKDFLIEEEDGVVDDTAWQKAVSENRIRGNCLLVFGDEATFQK